MTELLAPSHPSTPLEAFLRASHAAARRRYPEVDLDYVLFRERATEHASRRLARAGQASTEPAIRRLLESSALADLFLATACDRSIPGAWERLEREYGARLEGLARSFGLAAARARELCASLPGFLFLSAPTARTQIGTFDGTGSLFAWLAVVLRRLCQAERRAESTLPRAAHGVPDLAAEASRPSPEPIGVVLGRESAQSLRAELTRAFDELTPREVIAMLLRFRDDLPQRAIAGRLGITDARVSVLLAGAQAKLRDILSRRGIVGAPRVPEVHDAVASALETLSHRHSPPSEETGRVA